jgi:hypothetical protein
MDVWVVHDDSMAGTDLLAIFDHEPSQEELDALGPLRQDFTATHNAVGRPYTTRTVERHEVRGRAAEVWG